MYENDFSQLGVDGIISMNAYTPSINLCFEVENLYLLGSKVAMNVAVRSSKGTRFVLENFLIE